MKKVKMFTVVPANLATELAHKRKIADYNTLPQLNSIVLQLIRKYMIQRVGYENLPMACLSSIKTHDGMSGEDIFSYLPLNSKSSVIFELEMPEDMLVSISFKDLLTISEDAATIDSSNELELEDLRERLEDNLVLGFDDSMQDPISFIPFLAFDRCRFFAKCNSDFSTEELHLTGLTENNLRELASFVN